MEGIFLVDKPEGWTSFDVVAKVRGMVRDITRKSHEARGFCIETQGSGSASNGASRTYGTVERVAQATDASVRSKPISADSSAVRQDWRCKCRVKVGHTGTLDPAATGLLMICVGKATKKVPELIKQDKTYEVELNLGKSSDTGDKEGEIVEVSAEIPDSESVTKAINSFVGEIEQVPPVYSAIKIDGKRAYDLARAGKEVVMAPRKVTIYSIDNIIYEYPKVKFLCRVGSGTYIRSLASDIGEKLGVGAYMSDLRRTSIGEHSIDKSYGISDITPDLLVKLLAPNR
jgi:tRNA pseudouridine55 synthase